MDIENDDYIPISTLVEYGYCRRRCGLRHLENAFQDNYFTLQGTLGHERADTSTWEMTAAGRCERGMPIWSDALQIRGRADVVEFRNNGSVYPIEYKRGAHRVELPDNLQLCGQALCLEEMLNIEVCAGAVYSLKSRHRREVMFTADLRAQTLSAIEEIRSMLQSGDVPPPVYDERCKYCSLLPICSPELLTARSKVNLAAKLYSLDDVLPDEEDL